MEERPPVNKDTVSNIFKGAGITKSFLGRFTAELAKLSLIVFIITVVIGTIFIRIFGDSLGVFQCMVIIFGASWILGLFPIPLALIFASKKKDNDLK